MGKVLSTKKRTRNEGDETDTSFTSISDEILFSSESFSDLRGSKSASIFTLNQKNHIVNLKDNKTENVSFPNTQSNHINILVIEAGNSGIIPKKKDYVEIEYSGYLGDSDQDKTKQFINHKGLIRLGCGTNIVGLEQAIKKMTVGSTIKLWIPSILGYGSKGAQKLIPPDQNLFFHLKLITII